MLVYRGRLDAVGAPLDTADRAGSSGTSFPWSRRPLELVYGELDRPVHFQVGVPACSEERRHDGVGLEVTQPDRDGVSDLPRRVVGQRLKEGGKGAVVASPSDEPIDDRMPDPPVGIDQASEEFVG